MLENFFNPSTIAVVGVSAESNKLGSVVFNNIISAKYGGKLYAVNPKSAGQQLYGRDCIVSVRDAKEELDLVVVVVPAKFAMAVIDDCIFNKTKNVVIITAGFGEIGEHDLENEIARKCRESGINLLGPNCFGYISTFHNVNATFADGTPARGNTAFISQSGAFCAAMLDWARDKDIGFSHFISIGNKAHLSETELLEALKDDKNTKAFLFYLESIRDGQKFLRIAKEVVKTKPIVILEPGKSAKAQAASLSHTGSLAPNYRVLESALEKTGIIQAYNAGELFGLLEVLQYANHREFDGATAVVTNAGGVGVLTSDLCEDNELDLAKPSEKVLEKLKQSLPSEAALGNPIDVIGDAGADRYEIAMRTLCECGEYKNMLVLLTPQMVTDPMGTAKIAVNLAKEYKNINIFPVFVGGEKVRESLEFMRKNKMVCFGYPENITRLLGLLRKQMTYRDVKEVAVNRKEIPAEIKKEVEEAVKNGLASLPQDTVNKIMDLFKIDYPKSGNFTDKSQAFAFCKKLFPKAVVLKLSAPDALHKTEMKGIYLNVDNEIKFEEAWNGLWSSINKFNLRDASVLIQEMIIKSTEIIIGVNRDKTFGNVMVFGAGGVYTEVMKDTSLRVLPTGDFDKMISETKIGAILNGVRGETPKAVKPLADVMARIQEIVLSLPQIKSIDVNPVLVTADRAAAVDFKMILK